MCTCAALCILSMIPVWRVHSINSHQTCKKLALTPTITLPYDKPLRTCNQGNRPIILQVVTSQRCYTTYNIVTTLTQRCVWNTVFVNVSSTLTQCSKIMFCQRYLNDTNYKLTAFMSTLLQHRHNVCLYGRAQLSVKRGGGGGEEGQEVKFWKI